jgi:KUP system potassium uptake protein
LNGIWPASGPVPSKEDVIGGVSAIFWAMTLLPFLKYVGFIRGVIPNRCTHQFQVFFALQFETSEGEGGTFALFHGIFPPSV